MEIQVRFRTNLLEVITNPSKAAKAQNYNSITSFNVTETHRDNNMYLLCLIIKGYPEKYSFEGFNDFFAILVNPIPRSIWPGKPVRQEAQDQKNLYSFILDGPQFIGTKSLSYSVVGESYKAFGIIGIFIYAFVYFIYLSFFDGLIYYAQKREALSIGIFGLAVFLAFWGVRSLNALITFIYPLILILLIIKFFSVKMTK